MLGTVKWFNVVRGFGFIIGDDGNEYFFHYSNIKGERKNLLSMVKLYLMEQIKLLTMLRVT